jgi:transcriptional regulator with XRE-family HTH domain
MEDINQRIAARVRELRAARGFTLDALATRCGVSRSMISMIERGASSATAAVLEKLAAGLNVPLADLFAASGESAPGEPLARRARQASWQDPESGYLRRSLSPPNWPSPMQMVEVEFPAGARVAYETGERESPVHQQIWILDGRMEIVVGKELHSLEKGDCLAMRLNEPLIFSNPAKSAARYVLAICKSDSVD